MSSDPRDYNSYSRNELPPLREVVGDALNSPARSSYRFDFDDVNRALPGFPKHDQYLYPIQQYPPERGPTLPPIRNYSTREKRGNSQSVPVYPRERTPCRDPSHDPPDTSTTYTYSTPTSPQPATGPATYSYNVLRTQQGDLVDVRTPSSRAQGILRPTAIIEDEDESHKRYKCNWPGCDKKYDRPSSLEVHRHTHTGSQPYPCQYPGCSRAFNVKSNMLRHFRSHSPPKARKSDREREKTRAAIVNDSLTDGEDDDDDDDGWPQTTPSSRFFHNTSSADFRSPSVQGTSSQQYFNSSRRH